MVDLDIVKQKHDLAREEAAVLAEGIEARKDLEPQLQVGLLLSELSQLGNAYMKFQAEYARDDSEDKSFLTISEALITVAETGPQVFDNTKEVLIGLDNVLAQKYEDLTLEPTEPTTVAELFPEGSSISGMPTDKKIIRN